VSRPISPRYSPRGLQSTEAGRARAFPSPGPVAGGGLRDYLIASSAHAARDASALPSNSSRSRNELSLVVPYTAGGPLDRSARKLTQETTALGNINVLNVAGEGAPRAQPWWPERERASPCC
jgi:hypothetical protein